VPIDPKLLDGYVGRYELEVAPGMIFTVTRDKDQLSVQLTGQPAFPVFPKGPRDFFLKVVEAQITFEVDAARAPACPQTFHLPPWPQTDSSDERTN
jgi:Domain of unknown function (DUF3471)